jgi:hypothetical protein
LPPPKRESQSSKVRHQAERDYEKGQRHQGGRVSTRRSRATLGVLRWEGREAASTRAISRQAHNAVLRRSSRARSASALKAVRTKGRARLAATGRKAARTRRS